MFHIKLEEEEGMLIWAFKHNVFPLANDPEFAEKFEWLDANAPGFAEKLDWLDANAPGWKILDMRHDHSYRLEFRTSDQAILYRLIF